MLVFWKQRLAFLATPKTGSTAVAMAMQSMALVSLQTPPELKHTTVRRWHRFVSPWFEQLTGERFETVALMREPRDWLGSWYRFRQRPEALQSTAGITFDAFVRTWCTSPRAEPADVGSQAEFLQPRNSMRCDHVFRYERMDRFVAFLEDRLDCEIVLPRVNVSPPARLDLSPETEAMLRRAAAADFALYESLPD